MCVGPCIHEDTPTRSQRTMQCNAENISTVVMFIVLRRNTPKDAPAHTPTDTHIYVNLEGAVETKNNPITFKCTFSPPFLVFEFELLYWLQMLRKFILKHTKHVYSSIKKFQTQRFFTLYLKSKLFTHDWFWCALLVRNHIADSHFHKWNDHMQQCFRPVACTTQPATCISKICSAVGNSSGPVLVVRYTGVLYENPNFFIRQKFEKNARTKWF